MSCRVPHLVTVEREELAQIVADPAALPPRQRGRHGVRPALGVGRPAGVDLPLQGRVVLLTGASSGIGAAAAERFAAAGADVAVLGRSELGLAAAAAEVERHGRRALVLRADVTDLAAVEAAVTRCARELGGIDVLALDHATTVFGAFTAVAPEDFARVVDVNLTGAVSCVRAALPWLTLREGVIVATGSIASKVPLPGFSSYAAAKAAERSFLHTLRIELRADRVPVRVALLHPGLVATPLWDRTASASGRLPRRPPEGYRPEALADGLVALAIRPRPELTLGGEAVVVERLWQHARPAGDLALVLVHRWFGSGRVPVPEHVGLREGVGDGTREGQSRMLARPSLWATVRLAILRLRRAR